MIISFGSNFMCPYKVVVVYKHLYVLSLICGYIGYKPLGPQSLLMVKSPLQVIYELLVGIIQSIVNTFKFIFEKLVELFMSLAFIANTGIVGMLVASVVGAIVVVLVAKFVFKSSKSLLQILLVYGIFVVILGAIFILTAPVQPNP